MAYCREVAEVAACAQLAACGAVGEPMPPLLKIPEAVPEVSVEQVEDEIVVRWAWPTETTEGTPLKNLSLFRLHGKPQDAGLPSEAEFRADNQVLAAYEADRFAALDPDEPVEWRRPVGDWAGQRWVLAVWAEGRNGKAVGFSERVAFRAVPPLSAPSPLAAESAPAGARISWPATAGADQYRVERANGDGEFQPRATASEAEFVDDAVAWDEPYRYRVRAFATNDDARARSAWSEPAAITPKDTFPPAAPSGLRAIAGPEGVALSWEPNSEGDLAGYFVYRAIPGANAGNPLNAEPLTAASYTDQTAAAGTSYTFSVAAVDTRGNLGARSEPVAIAVR